MNISIRGFLPLAFDDGKEKVNEFDNYVNSYIVVAGQKESPTKEQKDFERRLRETKTFLTRWKEELEMTVDKTSTKAIKSGLGHSKKVFIIHGRDEVSTLQLQKLLRDEWNLESLVLKDKPPRGRTLIEKFEEEAQKTDFAFAIYTADDTIKLADGEYFQARPNTIFELGWFYGRLGRNKVCILFKKGTKINSDLNGINTIEFDKTIQEKVLDIKAELKDAGII
jgi:predicted nucleotide-binding protein